MDLFDLNTEPLPGYRMVRYLGRGGFGEVWEVIAPGGVSKAIKITPIESDADSMTTRELEGLRKIRAIRHPYLLSIERFEIVGGNLLVVMELADKSLADRFEECAAEGLPGIPRVELLRYIREAGEVLDLLNNKHHLQHLDVKPENLFLLGGHVKVADFGLVQPKGAQLCGESLAITPPYAAPELFDGYIESTADQYSLAVTYQELLTGQRPFSATDIRGLIYQHLKGDMDFTPLPVCDRPVMQRAMSEAPAKRFPSCSDFVKSLEEAGRGGENALESTPSEPRTGIKTTRLKTNGRPKTGPVPGGAKQFVLRPPSQRLSVNTEGPGRSKTLFLDVVDRPKETEDRVGEPVRVSFVAFLPLQIFAYKLRGFKDELDGEIISCDPRRTVLRFRSRGVFVRKGVLFQVDTGSKDPNSDYRVVEASVWSTDPQLQGREFAQRGMLLIRYLKAYLMAEDREPLWMAKSAEEIRHEIFGE